MVFYWKYFQFEKEGPWSEQMEYLGKNKWGWVTDSNPTSLQILLEEFIASLLKCIFSNNILIKWIINYHFKNITWGTCRNWKPFYGLYIIAF